MKSIMTILMLAGTLYAQAQNAFPTIHDKTGEAEIMMQHCNYNAAETIIKKDIQALKRKRKPVAELEKQLERCQRGIQALKGTDKVVIIDSIVVDKAKFLSGYKFNDEVGTIRMIRNGESTEFETELGNRVFRSERMKEGGSLILTSYYKEDGALSSPSILEGLEVEGDMNYPFLMSDGITFYFASRDEEGLGEYDLYITRYDADEDKFYRAENMGFPYNSYANDYMLVIDEERHIGWFASDRYQPEDKVCIYTFIPNSSRHPYDYESVDQKHLTKVASLSGIANTWSADNEAERKEAKKALTMLSQTKKVVNDYEFTFVVNDAATYHFYSDFKSADARTLCKAWVQKSTNLITLSRQLDNMRNDYAMGNAATKSSMKAQIQNLEERVMQLVSEVHEAEKEIRKHELQ